MGAFVDIGNIKNLLEVALPVSATLLGVAGSTIVGRFLAKRTSDLRENLGEELRKLARERVDDAKKAIEVLPPVVEKSADQVTLHKVTWADLERSAAHVAEKTAVSDSRETDLYTRYADEAVRRSKITFWVALSIGILGVLVILAGAVLSLVNGVDVGIVTGVTGVIETSVAALLYRRADAADKRAGAWFEKASASLKESDNLQRSLEVINLVDDAPMRGRILAIAGMKQLFPSEGAIDLANAAHKTGSS